VAPHAQPKRITIHETGGTRSPITTQPFVEQDAPHRSLPTSSRRWRCRNRVAGTVACSGSATPDWRRQRRATLQSGIMFFLSKRCSSEVEESVEALPHRTHSQVAAAYSAAQIFHRGRRRFTWRAPAATPHGARRSAESAAGRERRAAAATGGSAIRQEEAPTCARASEQTRVCARLLVNLASVGMWPEYGAADGYQIKTYFIRHKLAVEMVRSPHVH
jgi:hypothetical protein